MQRDRIIQINMMNKENNDMVSMEFVISGEDIVNKSTRDLKEAFVIEAKNAFEKMLKGEKVSMFIRDYEKR